MNQGQYLKHKTSFEETIFNSVEAYNLYFNLLYGLAISIFEWTNMPFGCNVTFLEKTLFNSGTGCFFYDDVAERYMTLSAVSGTTLDPYGEPFDFDAYGVGSSYYHVPLTQNTGVFIYDNTLHTSLYYMIDYWAKRLWNFDLTIDINVHAQKTPIIIKATEQAKLSLLNLYKKYVGNEPVIFSYEDFTEDAMKVFDLKADFKAEEIYSVRNRVWNDALSSIGLPSVANEKNERMNKQEVQEGSGFAFATRYMRLNTRQEAIEKINHIFGLDVGVQFRMFHDDEILNWRNALSGINVEGGIE